MVADIALALLLIEEAVVIVVAVVEDLDPGPDLPTPDALVTITQDPEAEADRVLAALKTREDARIVAAQTIVVVVVVVADTAVAPGHPAPPSHCPQTPGQTSKDVAEVAAADVLTRSATAIPTTDGATSDDLRSRRC